MTRYFLLSSILFAVGFVFYNSVLKQNKWFQANRFYLLLLLIATALLPVLPNPQAITESVPPFETQMPTRMLRTYEVTSTRWSVNFEFIYWIGFAISTLMFLYRFISTAYISLNPEKYLSQNHQVAFSFFNRVLIGHGFDNEQREMIEMHERTHIKQWHSLDVMMYELAKVVFWFNPLIHLASKEISLIHEFIADEQLNKRFGRDYQFTLLNHAMETKAFPMTNSFFNQSFIKQRIMKMNQNHNRMRAAFGYALVIPVALLALGINACGEQAGVPSELSEAPVKTVNPGEKLDDLVPTEELDAMPQYVGGDQELYSYLSSAIKYPEELKSENIDAITVYVQYVIERDGKVNRVEVIRSGDERFNQTTIEAITNMPNWEPGIKNGEPVPVKMVIPIKYKLA